MIKQDAEGAGFIIWLHLVGPSPLQYMQRRIRINAWLLHWQCKHQEMHLWPHRYPAAHCISSAVLLEGECWSGIGLQMRMPYRKQGEDTLSFIPIGLRRVSPWRIAIVSFVVLLAIGMTKMSAVAFRKASHENQQPFNEKLLRFVAFHPQGFWQGNIWTFLQFTVIFSLSLSLMPRETILLRPVIKVVITTLWHEGGGGGLSQCVGPYTICRVKAWLCISISL